MYNKLLIAMLLVAFVGGLLLVGPRRLIWSRWVIGSALLGLVIGSPNVVYQATHHWPELTMGRALADNNAGDVHVLMWPFLVILLGPPLTVIWVAGLVALCRRRSWRPVRFLAAALPVLLVLVFVSGTQFYYPYGLLAVLLAVGCVPTAELMARSTTWRALVVGGVAVNALVSATLALPLVPISSLGATPIPAINQTARDAVGWPAYVRQIAQVYDGLPAAQARHAVVIASNYGEAGAVARYGSALGTPAVYSAQNQLYFQSRPPDGTTVVVVVGGEMVTFRREFRSCRVRARLHDDEDVDNEEQGEPIAVCRGPVASWPVVWAALQHYD